MSPLSLGDTLQLSSLVLVVEGLQHKQGVKEEKDTLDNISKHFATTMSYCPEATLVMSEE